jgi:hypothetical protein
MLVAGEQQAVRSLAVLGGAPVPELVRDRVPVVAPEDDVVLGLLPDPVPDRSILVLGGAPLLMQGEFLGIGAVPLGLVPMVRAEAGAAARTAIAAVASRKRFMRGLSSHAGEHYVRGRQPAAPTSVPPRPPRQSQREPLAGQGV